MNPQSYLTQAIADITPWFKDHVATLHTFPAHGTPAGVTSPTQLLWAKPGTRIYGVRYLWLDGTLFVDGDLGEAVYRWGDPINLAFLARCDLDYFHGKLCASEKGRHYWAFDEAVARHRLTSQLDDLEPGSRRRSLMFEFLAETWHDPREDLKRFAWNFYDQTGDCELASIVHEAGHVPDHRLIAHWLGLRLAHTQLADH